MFGSMIRTARESLGLDQAELAQRVGVRQQTVSRWESGAMRPRRQSAVRLAEELGLDRGDALEAAGHAGSNAGSEPDDLPVRPLTRALPFYALSEDRFEDVCCEILQHLYPGGHASRFGGPGEKQDGIDLIVGDLRKATAQAKRHVQFGPKDVQAAVEAVADPAPENFLFLSRQTATTGARKEIELHATWQLWDGADMSSYIRTSLSADDAARLVRTYFPSHLKDFLGVSSAGPWLTRAEFYAPMTGTSGFSHDWRLVGRTDELAQLEAAITDRELIVSVLIGRGGIGKTRLLRTVAETFEAADWIVRFLPAGATVAPDDYDFLPSAGDVLVILDDIHERPDTGRVLAGVLARNPSAHVLLACRPYGRTDLGRELSHVGRLLSDVPQVPLGDLIQEDAEELAAEALGPVHVGYAARLAALTKDCPLATTIGGYLIRAGKLNPLKLEQDEGLREQILRGFIETLVAEAPSVDRSVRRAVVDALAALQPFRTADPTFQGAISGLVGHPYDRISQHLRGLEDSGVVIRRGDAIRLVPDLLGDVVLAEASVDERSGTSTGYLERVLEHADGEALLNAFVNVARVDWQVDRRGAQLAQPFWEAIQRDLERGDLATYLQLLQVLKAVALFQAEQTIATIRWMLDHPVDPEPTGNPFRRSWGDVLNELPAVLRTAAFDVECLPDACSLLWDLAQSDTRPTNQYPDHPIRILSDLSAYSPGKPSEVNAAMLELAEQWALGESAVSPLKVIEGLVQTEGEQSTYRNHAFLIRPFAIKQDVVSAIRRRAIGLALAEIGSGDVRRGVAGAAFVRASTQAPRGTYGREVSDEERDSWNDDFVETINAVGQLVRSEALDPAVCIALTEALHWHAEFGSGVVHDAAKGVLQDMPSTVEFKVAHLLHDGWARLVRKRDVPWDEHEKEAEEFVEAVAELCVESLSDVDLAVLLEHRMLIEIEAFQGGDSYGGRQLVAALASLRPSTLLAILDRAACEANSPLLKLCPTVIGLAAEHLPDDFMDLVRMYLDHDFADIRTEVAVGLAARSRRTLALFPGEIELLRDFATNEDERIRIAVVHAAYALVLAGTDGADELLKLIQFADSTRVADQLLLYFALARDGLRWHSLRPETREHLLREIERLPSFEGYELEQFLKFRAAEEPEVILGMLRRRIERWERGEVPEGFSPTPILWHGHLALRGHPDFLPALKGLLDWLAQGNSPHREQAGRDLFRAAAGQYDEAVLTLLLDYIRPGDAAAARAVASVLSEGPNGLVFEHVDFVVDLLEACAKVGEGAVKDAKGSLWASVIQGSRTATAGQPFAEDVRMRDEAATIAGALPAGSRAAVFYRELSEYGAQEVERTLNRDRDDDRRW